MKTHKAHKSRSRRRGAAVLAALVAVFLVFALCMAFVELSRASTQKQRHAIDIKRAFYLCEAGLAEGYAGLTIGKTGNVGTAAEPAAIGDGLFWVEATAMGDRIVELRSTAMVGVGRVTLGLAAQPVQVSMSSLGVFSSQDFATNPNTFIDSYDSSQGTYGEQVAAGTNDQAIVGSNGDVIVGSGTEIRGDAVPGPVGVVTLGAGASVTGSTQGRPAAAPLPPVEVPTFTLEPSLVISSATPHVVAPGEYAMEQLSVRSGSEVVLTGPTTAVFGELSLASNASLLFDNRGGPVDIFVTDDLDLSSGSLASTLSDDPGMASIQVSAAGAGKVRLGADALFYGQIYAPLAHVKVLPSFEIFGTLIAELIDISSTGRVHHDRNTTPTREDILPRMWSWRVVDIPDAVARRGGDPFQVLGVDRAALPSPSQAHQDQVLALVYLDLNDSLQVYDGMESGFDWTQVSSVLAGTRDGTSFLPIPGASTIAEVVEEPLSPEEQALVDQIASPMSSADLTLELQARSPGLSDRVLLEAIKRVPPMDSRDLYWALLPNGPYATKYVGGQGAGPLSDSVLMGLLQQSSFASKDLGWILEQNSPLPATVLDGAINRDPPMNNGDLNMVLRAQ